ncbi:MAG: Cfr10I/Bse634I family restriction endonuclease [Cyanosarcina radialis HA8281-LM2]|nr:Cfr10I/Bse634I family restriction endonuclease [Cyanosarcina radialis HA8281-LM2]
MSSYSTWFEDRRSPKGEVVGRIKKQIIYESLSSEIVQKIEANLPANQIIDWIKEQTRNAHYERYSLPLEVGALNNVAGDWNEFMVTTAFSEIAVDINDGSRQLIVTIFPLPNTQISSIGSNQISSRFLSLFKPSAFNAGGELHAIDDYKDKIFFSSPDYIIAVLRRDCLDLFQNLLINQARRPSDDAIYRYLEKTLNASELKAAVSVKTEYRPDRRYQPLFEADLVKQLGRATKQNWKFYMVSSKETSADTSLFDRITTPDAHEHNYKLVDGSFVFLRKADLIPLVENAIN